MQNISGIILDAIFIILLILCSITDIKKRIIPNKAIILLLSLGIVNVVCRILLGGVWWHYILGLIYSVPFFIAWHKNMMGAGDVKLIIAISLYLGFFNSLIALFFMCISLLIWSLYAKIIGRNMKKIIPLAPTISAGFITCIALQHFFF